MKPRPYMLVMGAIMLFTIYKKTNFQHQHAEMETRFHPFDSMKESDTEAIRVGYLPQGIVQPSSDLELKPLWFTKSSTWKGGKYSHRSLLAMAVGIKQKKSVNAIVDKFFSEKFTVILFHYDGNVDEWHDLGWSNRAIHIVIYDQTKWWFAKRFLHPDVVSVYDYIFLWDEDLGVDHFHPGRYLKIMKSEGLEISHPALDPHISEIHHRITVRRKKGNAHRGFLIIDVRENIHMPVMIPCTGLVEGMAPVFSRSAWRCVWHLIQDDLIHGWGTDMKLGYCAQGDRTKRIGIIDSEFIVHHGLQTLGGSSTEKYIPPLHQKFLHRLVQKSEGMPKKNASGIRGARAFDSRIEVRRQATLELQKFQERWERAVREDKDWVDPFQPHNTSSKNYTFIASRPCNGSSKNHTSNAPPPCSSSSKNHTSYTPPPCNGSSKNHSAIAPPPQNGSRNNHTSSVSLPHNTSSRSHVSGAHLRRNRGSKGHTSTARLPRYKSNRNHNPSARLARYRSSRNHAF